MHDSWATAPLHSKVNTGFYKVIIILQVKLRLMNDVELQSFTSYAQRNN